jgi:lipid-A-disaccharide synthase
LKTILVSAGDLSGERHAADLVEAIRVRHPDARFVGMGGTAMAAVGVELIVDQRELAVGGIFETFTSLTRVVRAWREMTRCLRERNPDLVILVDSGGFNLPFARRVRKRSRARIFYYVAPQVWAWREHRLRKLAERTDRIAVILPFEREFYAARGVEVDFVGHPILDQSAKALLAPPAERRRRARARMGIEEGALVLGLFPGSRRSEVGQHLELLIESFRILRRARPGLQAVIPRAPTLDATEFAARLAAVAGDAEDSIHHVGGDTPDALDAVDVAIAKPGTITLELMMRGCPMVVTGRAHPLTARIVRRSLRAAYLSLPNLLMGKEIVPERIQEDARPDRVAAAVEPLFEGDERTRQIEALVEARDRLGPHGAARLGAQIVEDLLGSPSA